MKSSIIKLGALALISLAATSATAETDSDWAGPACGKLVPVDGDTELLSAQSCQCSGAVSLTVVAGSLTIQPTGLVCYTHKISPDYQTFQSGGDTLLDRDKWVSEQLVSQNCNTSDCSWFFGWWGTPTCDQTVQDLNGGGYVYVAVGNCKDGVPIGTDSDGDGGEG
ncbi:hypothetical protein [Engelhardtia mirabilis]|uniref:Secreted protein n=1 Tax=Engelhardtia mirabilis TaxID=2528011 RepID=A0A518BDV9_9BACT|nr:hypothetical protein Pla133_02390 [Planctomycetes bacterium Pla133]QDU99501.1 hypothetical protein Pla86_02390 [Planctomycetes bacterium Pla86]